MSKRLLWSAVAAASLAVATPAVAGMHEHAREVEQEKVGKECPCAAGKAGAAGDAAPERERADRRGIGDDPFDRSMDAGG